MEPQQVPLVELSIHQHITSAVPAGGPQAASWLPSFAGASWLAYGASSTVVITTALSPSNPQEAVASRFFQQVLETGVQHDERVPVISVSWAPANGPSVGHLAATAGSCVHLFSPTTPSSSLATTHSAPESLEIPLAWEKSHVLEQKFKVLACSWTDSGDGLLLGGTKVAMWAQRRDSWHCLWEAQSSVPQALVSASWASNSLVATADEELELETGDRFLGPSRKEAGGKKMVKGKVAVWWWVEGNEAEEIELIHPRPVTLVQWRPSKGQHSSDELHHFRPVLLTSCRDGTIRLWLEIDSRRNTTSTRSHADRGDGRHMKPAFFVSAVIEVNRCLSGILGQDVFVTWASETRPEGGISGLMAPDVHRQSSSNGSIKACEVATCEWLVGVGPRGVVSLWSLHCLDDTSPPRCPRVTLWQQGADLLLSLPSLPYADTPPTGPLALKAIVQRPEGTLGMPPSSLDLFEAFPGGLFRWSRLWPPVSAIGTGSVVKTGIVNASPAAVHPKTVSKSTWGVSSDVIFLGSHLGDVIQAVVHPSDSLGLAASLDTQGVVLLWDSAGYSRPQVSVTNVNLPVWKLVGRLDTHIVPRALNFNLIAWAPILLPGDKAVLVMMHSQRIDCYLICKNSLKGKSGFISDHLLSLQGLGLGFRDGHELEGICAVPVPMVEDQQPDNTGSKFLVLGIGGGGSILASWIVELQVMMGSAGTKGVLLLESSNHLETRAAERIEIQDSTGHTSANFLDSEPDHLQKLGFTLYTGIASQNARIYTREDFIGSISLASQQHVKCIASAVGTLFPLEMPRSSSHPYDVLTGCGDGTIRLYKAQSFKDAGSLSGSQEDRPIFWQCVGSIKAHLGPVSKVASSGSGGKFASASNIEGCIVKIWDAESYIANIKFGLEVQISVPGQVTALSWLDVGNGIPLLGVATDGGFRIFIQSNCLSGDKCTTRSSNWVCLASSTLHVTSFLWDTQGSPIVVSRGNLLALSLWVSATSQQNHQMMDLKLTTKSGLMSSVNGGASSNGVVARELPRLRMREPCTILEAAELFTYPLPDYHPTAIVWSLFKGNKIRARMVIRHLAHHLVAKLATPSIPGDESSAALVPVQAYTFQTSAPPHLSLRDLLEVEGALTTKANTDHSPVSAFSLSENVSDYSLSDFSDKYSFLNSTSWLDEFAQPTEAITTKSQCQESIRTGGAEGLSLPEFDAIKQILEQCPKIDGLSGMEQNDLLAAVDLLAEVDGLGNVADCKGLDQAGQRFWLAYRYTCLCATRAGGTKSDVANTVVESKAMAWALQSDTKETLLDICASQQATWPALRALGVGFWFTDATPLRRKMEQVARAQYLVNKDPKESALLYIALERRSLLAGLLKISKDERDKALVNFLARDFKDEKHQAAALKNAYVLMGKHRHELAAAFFLLGGDANSAVSVCTKNLGDPQLGLVVCRLIEGSDGPLGHNLITRHILPAAKRTGDYWLASLSQWLLGRGVETMQEVINSEFSTETTGDVQQQQPLSKIDTNHVGWTSWLDPDLGDYCILLASKPRVRAGSNGAESSSIVTCATMRAVLALKRCGLPLQALELLMASSGGIPSLLRNSINHDDKEILPTQNSSMTKLDVQASGFLSSEHDNDLHDNWVNPDVLANIQEALRQALAVHCISQLLEEHPQWASCTSYLQHPEINGLIELQSASEPGHSSTNMSDLRSTMFEEADKKIVDGLQMLGKTFSINVGAIAAGLITWTQNHRRIFLLCRLIEAYYAHLKAPEQDFQLLPKLGLVVPLWSNLLRAAWKDAPCVLSRIVLACSGGSGAPNGRGMNNMQQGSVLPWVQIRELVRYAQDIQMLAHGIQGDPISNEGTSSHGVPPFLMGKEDSKQKVERSLVLLGFLFCVAAAWLGQNAEALLVLLTPIITDVSHTPQVPANFMAWFEADAGVGETIHTVSDTFGDAKAVRIPENDVWRVLGVCIWVHLLTYVRRQLAAGTGKDSVFSGFGWVSLPHSPLKSPRKSLMMGAMSPSTSPPASPSNRLVSTFLGLSLPSQLSVSPSTTWSDFRNKMRDSSQLAKATSSSATDEVLLSSSDDGNPSLVQNQKQMEDFGIELLSSISCISKGLHRQLAVHLQHLLNREPKSSPVVSWLWGKLMDPTTKETASATTSETVLAMTTSASGGVGLVRSSATDRERQLQQMPSVLYPDVILGTGDDQSLQELWKLLVAREKVRSALELEGVNGPQPLGGRKMEVTGWRTMSQQFASPSRIGETSVKKFSTEKITGNPVRDLSVAQQSIPFAPPQDGAQSLETSPLQFQMPEVVLHLNGELIEALCVNSCNSDQLVLASNRKGLVYLDLSSHVTYTESQDNLWAQADWPRNGWAGAISTPVSTLVTPGIGLGGRKGSGIGLGGAAVGLGALPKGGKEIGQGAVAFGMPGYGGMGAWGGWEDWEDVDGCVDPPATVENVSTRALAAHPLRPLFLVGSNNTHIYLWEFGKPSAMATYGVLPAANVPPPYVLASVASVRFDWCGHRFVTAALDGTVCTWQLEVGGRSNVRPTESRLCFGNHASDASFLGGSGGLVAATGMSSTGDNLVLWDTLAPTHSSRASATCHEGGARCLSVFDVMVGGGSSSPWIVTGGKGGDVMVHDFRYIATGRGKKPKPASGLDGEPQPTTASSSLFWSLPKAHSGSVTKVTAVPGTSLFFTGSKDGDVKLWDVSKATMLGQWHKVHDRHTFLQHNARGFGAFVQQAAVTDVQPVTNGFLTCGGDGIVKLFKHQYQDNGAYRT